MHRNLGAKAPVYFTWKASEQKISRGTTFFSTLTASRERSFEDVDYVVKGKTPLTEICELLATLTNS